MRNALFKQGNGTMPAKNMGDCLSADSTEVLGIPQRDTLLSGSFQCCSFGPVAIERFALIIDTPALLPLLGPETKIQGIQQQHPVYCAFGPIVEVIARIPCWRCERASPTLFVQPLFTQLLDGVGIDPHVLTLLYYCQRAAQDSQRVL